jgi:hypothetical protein
MGVRANLWTDKKLSPLQALLQSLSISASSLEFLFEIDMGKRSAHKFGANAKTISIMRIALDDYPLL